MALCERPVFTPRAACASIALALAMAMAVPQFDGCGIMFHATLRQGTAFMNS